MSDLDDRLHRLGGVAVPPLAPLDEVLVRGDRRRRRARAAVAGLGVVVVLGAGGTAYGLLAGRSGSTESLQPAGPVPSTSPVPVETTEPAPSLSPSPATPIATPPTAPTPPATTAPATPSSAPAGLQPGARLQLTGLGPLRLGMTWSEAEAATGRTIAREDFGGCTEGGVQDVAPAFYALGDTTTVQRIDITTPAVKTASGIGVGATEAEVIGLYAGLEVRPAYYDPAGHWLVLHPAGSPYELLFETDGSTVTSFRTGLVSFVEAPEGCH